MKVGDLVRYRSGNGLHNGWLGLILREIPGHAQVKVVDWTHKNMGKSHGSHSAQDLVLVQK